ncbi:hypothetical protein [Sporosarcina sp. E16_8]|uniref:RNA polymerase sigma factor n=1 Tax=Sporosarcina sp. E16_8 TaxID=2789295 RepID=UPI001A935E8D|nr:hypothetical protein [Sporosarcina sp. E16_8]MBO0589637.1 hypothetical protein [Sporosarcina sp. E16_8]
MTEFELVQKVRAGEREAFEKWMDIYSGDVERFAIQYGCAPKQAADVAEETFRKLHIQLDSIGNEESLVCMLYKHALKSLTYVQLTDAPNETLFTFEEDQELHDQIVNIETGKKVPFILSHFHMLDDLEIAAIMDSSPERVEQTIAEASRDLGDRQLEKRIEFLEKSYRRLNSSFRKEQVFVKPQQKIQATEKLKQSISKKAVISWITGIIILLSLVIVPIITGEEYKKASAEKYVERLKGSFENEMESRYSELGLTESTEKEKLDYNYIRYGKQARDDFESMIARYESVIAKTGTLNKEKIEDEYGKIINQLELPSEMVSRVVKNSLVNDKVKSEEFMKGYIEQYDTLQQAYYMTFIKHDQIIADAIVDETFAGDTFMQNKDTYPEELQQALDGMIKQNIYPTFIKGFGTIAPIYGKNDFSAKIRSSIHKDFGGFFTSLESAPFVSYPGLVHSLGDSVDFLLDMENTLLSTTMDDEKTDMLKWTYSELFYEIVGGAEPNHIFGTDGKVKTEFREGWKRIASAGEGSPTALIMQMVISEMEVTDWIESESLKRLEAFDVDQALKLAKARKLETFSMSGIMLIEKGLEIVKFPNPSFENKVQETYYSFSSNHDLSVLKEVSPLVIIGMYFYANDQKDQETMWHLYSKTKNVVKLEEFINEWSQLNVNIYSLYSLRFDGSGETAGSIGFQRGNTLSVSPKMALNEDSVWEIEQIILSQMLVE